MQNTLESLKFVQGATSETQLDPRLSHFLIRDGYVSGFNGHMQLSSPIDVDTTMAPRAKELVRALEQCNEEVELLLTKTGNLRLISGSFAAVVPTIPYEDLVLEPPPLGKVIIASRGLLDVLKIMKPFISDDASRTWSTGILFGDGYAYATNNIVVARMPTHLESDLWFNLPLHVVNEMLRIDESPNAFSIHANGTKITVIYCGRRIINSTLGGMDWPDLNTILQSVQKGTGTATDAILENIDKVRHFTDSENSVYISPDSVHTSLEPVEEGAVVQAVTGARATTRYSVEMFRKLKGEGNLIDLTPYPAPAPFWNEKTGLFGAIVGRQV